MAQENVEAGENAGTAALVDLTRGCALIRSGAQRLVELGGVDDAAASTAVAVCRELLLEALQIAPELRDVLVVPARK